MIMTKPKETKLLKLGGLTVILETRLPKQYKMPILTIKVNYSTPDRIQFQRNFGNTSRAYAKIAQELLF